MLQCRNGKRTAAAAVRMAVEMVEEGLINKEEAIMRVGADQLDQLLHPMLDPKAEKKVIATGLPASPGAAVGRAVFNAEDAESWAAKGEKLSSSVTKPRRKTSAACTLRRALSLPAAV